MQHITGPESGRFWAASRLDVMRPRRETPFGVGFEESRALMQRLRSDAASIAGRFELRYRAIEAERPNVRSRYGVCYSDGTIRIRLRHARTGKPLKYSSLVATLCHELAHLKHFNHGLRFRAFNQHILEWARAQGIYQPGGEPGSRLRPARPPVESPPDRSPAGPRQLELF